MTTKTARRNGVKTPKRKFVPFTPAGTPLIDCEATTEDRAWENLMAAAAHMPYPDKAAFVKRGYTVEELVPLESPSGEEIPR